VKFFLDENFPRKATRMLESHGFEVFDIRGTEIEGADDKTLFEKAQQHEAIFLTTDKDFYHTVPFFYESH
jgi:predicted nuclease of predicted toxin-antitoxin system